MKFYSSCLKAVKNLDGIEIQPNMFWLLALLIICPTLIIIIGKFKGEKPIHNDFFDFIKDMLGYTASERNGKIYQKMNYGLFILLGIGVAVFLLLFVWTFLVKIDSIKIPAIGLVSTVLCLFIMTPLCMRYTRHFG